MSNIKIDENATNILNGYVSKLIHTLIHQTKYLQIENQNYLNKHYLCDLFSRNTKKTHTDQIVFTQSEMKQLTNLQK